MEMRQVLRDGLGLAAEILKIIESFQCNKCNKTMVFIS
jgi:hypothetical protein